MSDAKHQDARLTDPRQWVDLHGDSLFRYAMRWMGDQNVAEDLVQETFLSALKARDKFIGHASERTWLVAILKNKIVDHLRRVSRERPLEDEDETVASEQSDFRTTGLWAGSWKSGRRPAEWMIDASDRLEQEEFWRYFRQCLESLPKRAAHAFVLREMEEEKSEIICNKLGVSSTNLRVLLHRARLQLRRCLEINWIAEKSG